MSEQDHYQLVLCTCPDQDSAQSIADHVVDHGLAACVNILPGITSVYRWQNNKENTQELLLVMKTVKTVFKELEKTIKELHPYELPEIIGVPIQDGSSDYLNWISENTTKNRK